MSLHLTYDEIQALRVHRIADFSKGIYVVAFYIRKNRPNHIYAPQISRILCTFEAFIL